LQIKNAGVTKSWKMSRQYGGMA